METAIFFLVLFVGMVIGFSAHGLAVQFMNRRIRWKITVHSCLLAAGAAGAIIIGCLC